MTISCGSAYYNSITGLTVFAAALKLQGLRSYLNGTDENILTKPSYEQEDGRSVVLLFFLPFFGYVL